MVLLELSVRSKEGKKINNIAFTATMRVWGKHQHVLSLIQSQIATFIYHPKFQAAVNCPEFSIRKQKEMDTFYKLGSVKGTYTQQHLTLKIGSFPGKLF